MMNHKTWVRDLLNYGKITLLFLVQITVFGAMLSALTTAIFAKTNPISSFLAPQPPHVQHQISSDQWSVRSL